MRKKFVMKLVAIVAAVTAMPLTVSAQRTCDFSAKTGDNASITLVNAIPRLGTSKANMAALDGSYYELSNDAGFTQVLFATEIISDAAADNDRAPFGLIFINPTNSPITITQVDLNSDPTKTGLFRASPAPLGITPATGWSWVNSRTVRWTGSLVVAAHSGVDFLVEAKISNFGVNILNNVVTATAFTNAGTFTAVGYETNVYVPSAAEKVATAVVAFDSAGVFPRGYVTGLLGGVPNDIDIRIREWANNEHIAPGMKVNVTIPAGWTNASVVSAPAPWDISSVVVTPATATTDGLLTISTRTTVAGQITKGTTSAAFRMRATPPVAYADSVFNVRIRLDGKDTSAAGHTIRSVCDGVVQVLPQSRAGINVEFLSPALTTAAPIRSADFTTTFNSINGLGTEAYSLDVFNFATNAWEAGSSIVPTASNLTLNRSFTSANIDNYLDTSDRMRFRINSPSTATTRTLRIDHMAWQNVVRGWSVDNSKVGAADTNRGSVTKPLATIQGALTRAAGGDPIYVQGTAIAYAANNSIEATKPGTAGCETMVFGVPDPITGQRPMVVGTNPTADAGFAVGANYAHVEGFDISTTQVALYSAPGTAGAIYRNNRATVPDLGYGVLLYSTTGSRVENNNIDAAATRSQFGIWSYAGSANTISGNTVKGHGSAGIMVNSTPGAIVRRNVVKGSYFGMHIARSTATVVNNTIDASGHISMYAESSTITSRNNTISGGGYGWRRNTAGAVDSNYDNVFGATFANYTNIIPGANSISAAPAFVQTTNAAAAEYYRPAAGSVLIDAGTNVGLPFNGSAPDIGAVER